MDSAPPAGGSAIHPTALVAEGASIGPGVAIGPYCIVGPSVTLEEGVRLVSHVVVEGRTRIHAGATLFPFCTVGLAPQDLKYRGEDTAVEIGPRTLVREHCSIHRGTASGTGVTRIGADCMLMAVVHVAHDCALGDGVIVSNNVVMGGHVVIGDHAVIGGAAAIHQFVHIGRGAMINGVTGIPADVIPFGRASGNHGRLVGLNVVGMRRRGFDDVAIMAARRAFRFLFLGPGVFAERVKAARARFGGDPVVCEILDFIEHPGRRGLVTTDPGALATDIGA